jgi:hypothetical protein
LCIRKATYNSKCRSIALWPAGIIEIVNVARTIWKVEDPCLRAFLDCEKVKPNKILQQILSLDMEGNVEHPVCMFPAIHQTGPFAVQDFCFRRWP